MTGYNVNRSDPAIEKKAVNVFVATLKCKLLKKMS